MTEKWLGAIEHLGKEHQDIEISLPDGKITFDWNNQESYFKLKKIIFDFAKKEYPNEIRQDNSEEWMLKKQIGNLEHTKDFCAECCERLEKENEELKSEIEKVQREYEQLWMRTYSKEDKNCHNCKNCETYDEGEGYGCVSLCKKDCMNTDGYFDYEYHRFKKPCICPFWEEDEYD